MYGLKRIEKVIVKAGYTHIIDLADNEFIMNYKTAEENLFVIDVETVLVGYHTKQVKVTNNSSTKNHLVVFLIGMEEETL